MHHSELHVFCSFTFYHTSLQLRSSYYQSFKLIWLSLCLNNCKIMILTHSWFSDPQEDQNVIKTTRMRILIRMTYFKISGNISQTDFICCPYNVKSERIARKVWCSSVFTGGKCQGTIYFQKSKVINARLRKLWLFYPKRNVRDWFKA